MCLHLSDLMANPLESYQIKLQLFNQTLAGAEVRKGGSEAKAKANEGEDDQRAAAEPRVCLWLPLSLTRLPSSAFIGACLLSLSLSLQRHSPALTQLLCEYLAVYPNLLTPNFVELSRGR